MLLAAACSEMSLDALAKLSIGQRDAHLLTLREWTFGSQLVGLVSCPRCYERLELTFKTSDLRVAPETPPAETFSLSIAGYELCYRPTNSLDLATIASDDPTTTRQRLLERCLTTARYQNEPIPADKLPPDVVNAVIQSMAQADPQADVQLALRCSSCGYQWQACFDIVSFFWREINAWAVRILSEVHILASAYGWREIDILTMSSQRRQFYLNLVSG